MRLTREKLNELQNRALRIAIIKSMVYRACRKELNSKGMGDKIATVKQLIATAKPASFETSAHSREELARFVSLKAEWLLKQV